MFQGSSFEVVFQLRQMPESYSIGQHTFGASVTGQIDPLFDNNELEYYTVRNGVHKIYRLLVRRTGSALSPVCTLPYFFSNSWMPSPESFFFNYPKPIEEHVCFLIFSIYSPLLLSRVFVHSPHEASFWAVAAAAAAVVVVVVAAAVAVVQGLNLIAWR
jgi:hypothetical protein